MTTLHYPPKPNPAIDNYVNNYWKSDDEMDAANLDIMQKLGFTVLVDKRSIGESQELIRPDELDNLELSDELYTDNSLLEGWGFNLNLDTHEIIEALYRREETTMITVHTTYIFDRPNAIDMLHTAMVKCTNGKTYTGHSGTTEAQAICNAWLDYHKDTINDGQ